MAKIDSFLTKYLTADDFREGERTVTIAHVREESVGRGSAAEEKLVAYFEELEDSGVVLNKTNLEALAKILGSRETDDWQGEKVQIYRDPTVQFGGKKVGGIAFKKFDPASAKRATAGG